MAAVNETGQEFGLNKIFETVGRTDSWAEQRTATATVIGKYTDLAKKNFKPGDRVSGIIAGVDSQYYVKTLDLTTPDGVTGELTISMVKCPQGKNRPFNVTWDISMEEVQRKLICHPKIQEECNLYRLAAWENTPAVYRRDGDNFYYATGYTVYANGQPDLVKITNEWEIAYCKAVTAGIQTYNAYYPVISRVSQYLELPGANYNLEHVVTGGTISAFSSKSEVGNFDDPPIRVQGYSSDEGGWFKSSDKLTSQPDGSWTRTEQWTFTPDKKHKWIYTGSL